MVSVGVSSGGSIGRRILELISCDGDGSCVDGIELALCRYCDVSDGGDNVGID